MDSATGIGRNSGTACLLVLMNAAFQIVLACYGVYAGIRLVKIKPHALMTAKVFLIAVLIYNLLMFVVTLVAEHRGNMRMDQLVKRESWQRCIRSWVVGLPHNV